jgi:LacI family transcriptional regulator
MRQSRASALPRQPLVGIAVEGVTAYGRSILRGVMRYANLQRRWVLHEDLWHVSESLAHWPECDGSVIAGVELNVFDYINAHSRFAVSCSGTTRVMRPSAMPVVTLDDEATGALAAKHLMDCGLRHFAFHGAAQQRNIVGNARFNGFRRTLAKCGFECGESEIDWPTHISLLTHAHHPALIEWLRSLPKPVGIMAADDANARDLAAACREANIAVPEHVAIIGVNNDDLLCESAWPPLSSVEVDFSRMGYLAAKLLDRMMGGEKLAPEETDIRLAPLQVVQRVSTNILAVASTDLADAIRFIREHACDPCSVSDVLRAVPVARRRLERQFVAQLGRTPHDEIARVRIETAQRLLHQLDLTIPDVAERCGFTAFQSFHRFFQQHTSTTPAAYRRAIVRGSRQGTADNSDNHDQAHVPAKK